MLAVCGLALTRFRKPVLALIVTADLGTLAFYKYIDFAVVNLNSALFPAGISFAAPGILLPIGISFYTFEVISYIVDVYRGKIKPERSLLDFALLLAFFPRLVAGPIVRPSDFLPQLKVIQTAQIGAGLQLVLIGMFQKLVIADYAMAPVVDWYFAIWTHTSSFDTWIAVLAFAIQIYCDFNGYTLCAIGLALLLGFRLPVNFANPYAAIGFSDFWRRWHISLSSWIRDYLYIPLGGSRHGQLWTCVSLLIAMTLAGLWHGASWNFVLWGLIYGTVLCVEHVLRAAMGVGDCTHAVADIGARDCSALVCHACCRLRRMGTVPGAKLAGFDVHAITDGRPAGHHASVFDRHWRCDTCTDDGGGDYRCSAGGSLRRSGGAAAMVCARCRLWGHDCRTCGDGGRFAILYLFPVLRSCRCRPGNLLAVR